MSRTPGKTVTSIEFDDPLFETLKAICAIEQSSMSRLVRIACFGFVLEYVTTNESKWAKPKEGEQPVRVGHIREAVRSDDAILLALAALTGRSERSMREEKK